MRLLIIGMLVFTGCQTNKKPFLSQATPEDGGISTSLICKEQYLCGEIMDENCRTAIICREITVAE